jgi:hypothetical protein
MAAARPVPVVDMAAANSATRLDGHVVDVLLDRFWRQVRHCQVLQEWTLLYHGGEDQQRSVATVCGTWTARSAD